MNGIKQQNDGKPTNEIDYKDIEIIKGNIIRYKIKNGPAQDHKNNGGDKATPPIWKVKRMAIIRFLRKFLLLNVLSPDFSKPRINVNMPLEAKKMANINPKDKSPTLLVLVTSYDKIKYLFSGNTRHNIQNGRSQHDIKALPSR